MNLSELLAKHQKILRGLFEKRANLESWDVEHELQINNRRESEIYNSGKMRNTQALSETLIEIKKEIEIIKQINKQINKINIIEVD